MSTEIVLPKLGLTMDEAKVVNWLKELGDFVEEDEVILEVETDKANLEVESPGEGYLTKQIVESEDVVEVGAILGILSADKDGGNDHITPAVTNEKKVEQEEHVEDKNDHKIKKKIESNNPFIAGERIRVSPAARKLAKQKEIELANVEGSGPRGRIVLEDVKKLEISHVDVSVPQTTTLENVGVKLVQLSNMRKIIAKRLTDSFKNVPQFTLTRGVDCTNVNETRKTINNLNDSQVKLSLNDFIMESVAKALKEHPTVNAYFIEENNGEPYVIEKEDVNIGIAVAIDAGLVVPVIHGVNKLSLIEIAQRRAELVKKAQEGKLRPEEMSGGTFTISNLGGYNIDEFTAIVNPPESGILAIGRAKNTPVIGDDMEMTIKPIMQVTASFDHRMIDGAMGAQFLHTVVEQLQSKKWSLI